MMGEATQIRKKVLGGFNQDDVAGYILKLANERNEALSLISKKDRKIDELKSQLQAHNDVFAEIDAKNKEIAELNLLIDALRIEEVGREVERCVAEEKLAKYETKQREAEAKLAEWQAKHRKAGAKVYEGNAVGREAREQEAPKPAENKQKRMKINIRRR